MIQNRFIKRERWREVKWEELSLLALNVSNLNGWFFFGSHLKKSENKNQQRKMSSILLSFSLQLIGQTLSSVTHWDKDLVNFSLGGCWVGVDLMISWRVPIRNHSLSLMMIWLTPHNEWMLSEINKHRYMNNEQIATSLCSINTNFRITVLTKKVKFMAKIDYFLNFMLFNFIFT